jgi:hypothetical protein
MFGVYVVITERKRVFAMKPRNGIVRSMIARSANGGLHTDRKKQSNKRHCRRKVDVEKE